MLVIIYTCLVAFYVISQFAFGALINYIIGILAVIALSCSFFKAKGSYLVSGVIFLISGIILFSMNKLPWYTFLLHFKPMLGLLSLFLVLPFVSTLLRVGHYEKNLSALVQGNISTLTDLYRRSFIVCFILGLFLNVTTFPLLITALDSKLQQLPDSIRNKFYSRNLLRAFFLCITWSPMEVMVSMSLDITKAKYYNVVPVIIFMVIMAIVVDWRLAAYKFRNISLSGQAEQGTQSRRIIKKTLQLVVMLVMLTVLISCTEILLNKGFLLSVVLVLLPFAIVWTGLIGKLKRYWTLAIPFWKERTKGLGNYFFMFLSAGFFIEMVSVSGLLDYLQPLFTQASKEAVLLYLIIAAYFLLTSLIGFHPLISLTFLAGLLQPVLSGVDALPLTIVLISCSLTPTLFGPYNLSLSIMSDQLKVNPYGISLWNMPFAIFYMLLSISVAYLMGL